MHFEQLDLEVRSQIYSQTKKVLRKYQKGITTGKLTATQFADNILSSGSIDSILDEQILNEQDFKVSYVSYIETLIKIQNENLANSKKRKYKLAPEKPSVTQRLQLKNLLSTTGYTLAIPLEYLNADDVENILSYITTNSIALGNERIYNYVHRPDLS